MTSECPVQYIQSQPLFLVSAVRLGMRIGHGQAQKDLMEVDGDQGERVRERGGGGRPARGGAPASTDYVL